MNKASAGKSNAAEAKAKSDAKDAVSEQRSRIPQSDVPSISVSQASRVAQAIAEHYAFKPTSPLRVAQALKVQPSSGNFRMLCGASSAYGFTKGTYSSPELALEPLGLSYVRPLVEGEADKALREALLKPRVVGEFLRKYHNAPLPRTDIARNVLLDMKVPADRTDDVLKIIVQGAEAAGFVRIINGKQYIDLDTASVIPSGTPAQDARDTQDDAAREEFPEGSVPLDPDAQARTPESLGSGIPSKRVFITHGKNRTLVDLIKRFLTYAEMEPVVLVEQETVAQPVPEKVMEAMRSCGAAVIHVDADQKLIDAAGKETVMLNANVMIEVGAALALYGRRFILLVRDGITLPSNLQGLYEVRYSGDTLDGTAVMKLLEALSDLKKRPLPK